MLFSAMSLYVVAPLSYSMFVAPIGIVTVVTEVLKIPSTILLYPPGAQQPPPIFNVHAVAYADKLNNIVRRLTCVVSLIFSFPLLALRDRYLSWTLSQRKHSHENQTFEGYPLSTTSTHARNHVTKTYIFPYFS